MTVRTLHNFNAPWTGSGGAFMTAGTPGPHEDAPFAGQVDFPGSAPASELAFQPTAPIDLSVSTEFRFWLRVPPTVDPGFPIIFGYSNVGDPPAQRPLWQVPAVRPGRWEHVRIGIAQEQRDAVDRLFFMPSGNQAVTASIAELLAVRPQMAADVETALMARITANAQLPELQGIPVTAAAAAGAAQIQVSATDHLVVGSIIDVDDGAGTVERFEVANLAIVPGGLTLDFANGATLSVPLALGTASISTVVQVVTEPHTATGSEAAAVRLTQLDVREDRRRTHYISLTDSYRLDAAGVVSASTRPHPRGWLIDYQLTAEAPTRHTRLGLIDSLTEALNFDRPLRVAGALNQLEMFRRVDLPRDRTIRHPEAVHLRICAEQEAGPRLVSTTAQSVELAVVPEGAAAEPLRIL